MRSRKQYNIRSKEVHNKATGIILENIDIEDHGYKCLAAVMVTIMFYAASRLTSLFDACQRLVNAPTDEAMRQALVATLPPIDKLERQLNSALGADLPKALRKRR